MQLETRRVVITGGGRGIGAATARLLAEAGASVVVAARSLPQIEGVAQELRDAGHEVHAVACDVTRPDQVEALRGSAEERVGPIDILVNNAGIADSRPLGKVTLADWDRIFDVNVKGVLLCTQAFLPGMVERGWGRIVNVASIAGKSGAAYISAYSASKHAVIGLTRCVAQEVATSGVTVNAICPGYVDTDMTQQSVDRIVGKTGIDAEAARQHILATSPQRRLMTAEEVAFAVLYLCDHRARGMNAQSLVIDGGAVQT